MATKLAQDFARPSSADVDQLSANLGETQPMSAKDFGHFQTLKPMPAMCCPNWYDAGRDESNLDKLAPKPGSRNTSLSSSWATLDRAKIASGELPGWIKQ